MKWPNDLLVNDAKIAGVLAQSGGRSADGRPEYVVVGIGVNVGWAPAEGTSLRECTEAESSDTLVSPERLLAELLVDLDALLALDDGERHDAYVSSLSTISRKVRVDLPDGSQVVGRALSVEHDGRLVVLDDCATTHRFDTADVVHLRAT